MKNKIIFWIVLLFLLFSIFTPTLIQYFFLVGENSKIVLSKIYSPAEILDFCGTALSALATVLLGALAFSQNQIFKAENDASQEKLNMAVNSLAEANRIIADTNSELLVLQQQNQRIQLILAQEFIPFLELARFECNNVQSCQAPIKSEYSYKQVGEIRPNVQHNHRIYSKQISFEIEIAKKTTLQGYTSVYFVFWFLQNSRAKISSVDVLSIKISNTTRDLVISKQELIDETVNIPDFSFSDWAIYYFHLVFSDDYNSIIQGDFSLSLELLLTISTGISYKEIVTIKKSDYTENKNAQYFLEPQ